MGLNIREKTANTKMLFPALKSIAEHNNFYGKRDWDNYDWKNVCAVSMCKGKFDGTDWFKIMFTFDNGDGFNYYSTLDYKDHWDGYSTSGMTGGDCDSRFKQTTQDRIVYLRQFAELMAI